MAKAAAGLAALVVVLLILPQQPSAAQADVRSRSPAMTMCEEDYGVTEAQARAGATTVALLVADPGDFSGSAEAVHYLANLQDKRDTAHPTVCGWKRFGTIMGQRVAVVTTGIGPTLAALCVQELLQCRPFISDMLYSGTSGFSVQKGGVLNANGKGANPSTMLMRIGDVCVSPLTLNWACQKADWTEQAQGYPNVDSMPKTTLDPSATFLYGACIFVNVSKASVDVTRELYLTSKTGAYTNRVPLQAPVVADSETRYADLLSEGTGVAYANVKRSTRPVVLTYDTCGEVGAQFFYSGVPWEMTARNFTALLINTAARAGTISLPTDKSVGVTQQDVVAVSAMEGIGVAQAVERYNAMETTTQPVSFTIVRANSNALHKPVRREPDGTWRHVPFTRDLANGYKYAIASYSHLVLSWLQGRCEKTASQGQLRRMKANPCTFSIAYPSSRAASHGSGGPEARERNEAVSKARDVRLPLDFGRTPRVAQL